VSNAPAFASATQAAQMARAALGFLAAADARQLAAEEQAQCLKILEQASAMSTAARAGILGAFSSGRGYCDDADYSPRCWLIHRPGSPRVPRPRTPPGPAGPPLTHGSSVGR
jgi:hypothetical protein